MTQDIYYIFKCKVFILVSTCLVWSLWFPNAHGLTPSIDDRGFYINTPPNVIAFANSGIACNLVDLNENCGNQTFDDSTGAHWFNIYWSIPDGKEIYSREWYCSVVDGSEPYESNIGYCKEQRFHWDTSKYACDWRETFSVVSGECLVGTKEEGGAKEAGGMCKQVGNPINLGVGNKYQAETDFAGSGAFPLGVIRSYNSITGVWQIYTAVRPSADLKSSTVVRSDGKKFLFSGDGIGGWIGDPDVTGILESFDDGLGNITGWRYTTLDQTVEDYDAVGKLLKITERTGLSHTYVNNPNDITVTHSNGDVLVYQFDSAGRVTGFISPDSQMYNYSYDGVGNLISITYPDNGGTRTYHYEDTNFPDALTGITDANGDRFTTWTYDVEGRAIISEHNAGSKKVTVDYTSIDDLLDPRVTTTNALGKQTTYHLITLHGVKKVTQVEGHASANCLAANKDYTYDANGFIQSKTDWKDNTTTYVRNTKGQELSRIEAQGSPEERTIITEWHPTFNLRTKVTEPDRETTYSYDNNGNLLTVLTQDKKNP